MTDIHSIFDTTKIYEFFMKDQTTFTGKIDGINTIDDERIITAVDETGIPHHFKFSELSRWVPQD